MSHTTGKPQENEKNETFPVSEGFIHEEKLDIPIWHAQCNLLPLESHLPEPLTVQATNQEHHTIARFISFFKGLFICVIHFRNSKCKNLIFSCLQINIGSEKKSPSRNDF